MCNVFIQTSYVYFHASRVAILLSLKRCCTFYDGQYFQPQHNIIVDSFVRGMNVKWHIVSDIDTRIVAEEVNNQKKKKKFQTNAIANMTYT